MDDIFADNANVAANVPSEAQAPPAATQPPPPPTQQREKTPGTTEVAIHTLQERGAPQVAAQQKEIEERTARHDSECAVKVAETKKKAQDYLKKQGLERAQRIAQTKELHVKQQADQQAQREALQKRGALWPSVVSSIDVHKPNALSKKGTERMRKLFGTLKEGTVPLVK